MRAEVIYVKLIEHKSYIRKMFEENLEISSML
jgi:hypothetical protein